MKYKGKSKDEEKILQDLQTEISEGVNWCADIHQRVEDNAEFERGEQWSKDDAERQAARERPALPLNSLLKLVNAVANREIMERIVPFVHGFNEEDNGIAEALQGANRWQRDKAETEHEESLAFRKCAASGYGVMHKWFDDTASEGHGMIADEAVPVWYMIWDPRARRQNLIDRRFNICGKFVPVSEVVEQWGDSSKGGKAFSRMIKNQDPFGPSVVAGGTPTVESYRGTWGDVVNKRWFSSSRKEVFLVEREWTELKKIYRVALPVNLELSRELTTNPEATYDIGENEDGSPKTLGYEDIRNMGVDERAGFFGSLMSEETVLKVYDDKAEFDAVIAEIESYTGEDWEHWHKAQKRIYKYAIVSADHVLETGIRPFGFTYEFMTGFPYETKDGMDWYGMVDVAKGAQDFKNKFFSNMLTLYMMSPKQHLFIEEGAVGDTDTFMNEYAKLGGVSFVPDGFIQSGRFMTIDAPNFPPMLQQLLQYADQAVMDVFGLSSVETGSQSDLRRVSGNVVNAARQASNTILASIFDALRRYRRRWGMLNTKFLQEYYRPDEIKRIVGSEVGQYLDGITEWGDINRFDIKIDEQPTSVTEQMDTVDLLTRTNTLEKWESQGKLTFPEALDLLVNIPQSKRDRIKRNYEARQGQEQQFQQKMQQLQQQMQAVSARMTIMTNVISMAPGGNEIQKLIENQYLIHEQIMPAMEQEQGQEQTEQ
jgi:hypothetical protein